MPKMNAFQPMFHEKIFEDLSKFHYFATCGTQKGPAALFTHI